MSENIMRVKAKKNRYDVTYMAGDDSGFDMMEGALLVLESLDLPINWRRADLGWCMWEKSNKKFGEGDPRCNTVPPETIKAIEETDATIMAAITSKAGVKGFKSAILQMRQLFDLYINLRPAKTLPGIGTPLAKNPDIDIVMFRENTEDLYAAVEFFPLPEEMFSLHKGMERFREGKGEIAVSWRVFSEEGCARIIRAAFEYAKATGRKTVHCCNKANVIRQTDGMMKRIFLEIAKEYEQYGIKGIEENADATAMWLIKNPQDYSVIVASNVFGDILSDEASQLTGGLGFAPSGNIGRSAALFEPSSGSVPKYAHQYKVNPSAMILTCKMMLVQNDARVPRPRRGGAEDRKGARRGPRRKQARHAHIRRAARLPRRPRLGEERGLDHRHGRGDSAEDKSRVHRRKARSGEEKGPRDVRVGRSVAHRLR